MTRDEFQEYMGGLYDQIVGLNTTKGHDYAGQEDALANFKKNAAELGLTPFQVWGVYAGKHWYAVRTFIREGDVKSEPIEGRVLDLILYLFLLAALVKESQDGESFDLNTISGTMSPNPPSSRP